MMLNTVRAIPMAFPRRIACNACGWQGRHLRSDGWHRWSICPRCNSAIRHRLLIAAMRHIEQVGFDRLVHRKRILHFAPERVLRRLFEARAASYRTADLAGGRADLELDISDMHSVAAGEYDLLVACDVLEHVADDRRAIREVFRILAPEGAAIFTVPQQDALATTFEDPAISDPADRLRLFGQHDHLRIYGADFIARLADAGFRVRVVSEQDFDQELVRRHVLFPPELSPHPLATNHRRIYFAFRPGN